MASWDGEKATGSTPTAQPQLQPRQQPLLHVLFDHSREIPPELVSLVQLAETDTDGAGANTDTDMVTKTGAETGGGTLPAQPSTTPLQQPPPPPPPTPLRTSMDEEWDTFYTDDGTPYYHHRDTDTVAWTLPSVAVSVQGKYIQLVKGFRDISPEIPRLIPQMLCPQSIMSMYTPDPFHLRVGFVVGVGGECGVCGGGGGVLLIIRRSCFQISNGRR